MLENKKEAFDRGAIQNSRSQKWSSVNTSLLESKTATTREKKRKKKRKKSALFRPKKKKKKKSRHFFTLREGGAFLCCVIKNEETLFEERKEDTRTTTFFATRETRAAVDVGTREAFWHRESARGWTFRGARATRREGFRNAFFVVRLRFFSVTRDEINWAARHPQLPYNT